METLSSKILEFEGKARSNRIGAPFRVLGKLLVLPANVRLDWKVIGSAITLAYLASLTVKKEIFL